MWKLVLRTSLEFLAYWINSCIRLPKPLKATMNFEILN